MADDTKRFSRESAEFDASLGMTLVSCPDCAFEFDAKHEDNDHPGWYTCPRCEAGELKRRVEWLRSARDFLSRDQVPLERRMHDAERRVREAQRVAAAVVDALNLPCPPADYHKPGDWQHDTAMIALGQWYHFPEPTP